MKGKKEQFQKYGNGKKITRKEKRGGGGSSYQREENDGGGENGTTGQPKATALLKGGVKKNSGPECKLKAIGEEERVVEAICP